MAVDYVSPADRQRAQDRVEVFARSMFLLQGLPMPGGDTMGNIVSQALGSIGANELRNPECLSQATIGRIGQLVSNTTDSGTPKNLHGAEAARALQTAGPAGLAGAVAGARFASLGGQHGGDNEAGSERSSNSETISSRRFNAIRAQDDRAREAAALSAGMGSPASTFMNQYGVDRGTATMFQNYGMTGGAYGGLVNQGYGAGQIKQAAQFAGELGVRAGDHAKSVIKLDIEEREAVKKAVEEARVDPTRTPEQRKAAIERLEKAHPGITGKMGGEKAIDSLIGDAMKDNRDNRLKQGPKKIREDLGETAWKSSAKQKTERGANQVVARAAKLGAAKNDAERSAALGDDEPAKPVVRAENDKPKGIADTPKTVGQESVGAPKKPEPVRVAAQPGGPKPS